MSLAENLKIIDEKIRNACFRSNRDPSEIQVIAVTKYGGVDLTREVLNLGLEHIGENRAEDAIAKYDILKDRGTWHFIGRIQSRKVKQLIGKFDYFHALDRLSLAEEIDKRANTLRIKVNCFIQINVSGEETKTGINPDELIDFIKAIKEYKAVKVVGLMTMAPFVENIESTRPIFQRLRELRDFINEEKILDYPLKDLSMGMSNDFEIAIEEGATFIRLGSVLIKQD